MGIDKLYDPRKMVIFLADDDTDDTMLFEQALEEIKIPHSLHVSSNGQQLISQLKSAEQAPDIIFLDINMPVKNGIEALVEMKDNLRGSIPVLMLSTSASQEMINSAKSLGASGYVCKPSTFPGLCSVLSRLLGQDWTDPARPGFIIEPARSARC